jgi:hypothetical protein
MFRSTTRRVVLVLFILLLCGKANAADDQTWSVKIVDDTAILTTAPETEIKFISATLDQLQKAGIKKLTLSNEEPRAALASGKPSYVVSVANGLAKIQVVNNLHEKYIESATKALGTAGIDFVTVSQ